MTFLKELAAHADTLTVRQRAEIKKRVRTPLNVELRFNGGMDNTIRDVTDVQLAFLDLLYPAHYEPLRKVAQAEMQDFLSRKRISPKLHELVLPKPDSDAWELTFSESFMGPVVYFTMKGWKAQRHSLIG